VKRFDVLPVLLEEGNQEVDTEHDVGKYLVLVHVNMSDSDAQAQDLLELELDSGAHLVELVGEVLAVGYWGRELAGLGETGPKETGNLLDEGLRGKESVVLLGEFLNELLVLVELLQVINRHVFEVDLFRAIDVGGVCENADGHARARNVGKLDSSRETLITLRVVVLETDLEFDSLCEFALFLAGGGSKEVFDGAPHASH